MTRTNSDYDLHSIADETTLLDIPDGSDEEAAREYVRTAVEARSPDEESTPDERAYVQYLTEDRRRRRLSVDTRVRATLTR